MVKQNAQVKMKAMVAARLLMGDFDTWEDFEKDRKIARQIVNRRIARSVSAQINRKYGDLSRETQSFISKNFDRCDYDELARLCDEVPSGRGIYMRLDEFEEKFFLLATRVKICCPFYAHVLISPYGLKFEFPEHHFLRDLESAFTQLDEIKSLKFQYPSGQTAPKERRGDAADLMSREKFLSRSIISASFSLVEAFLSGIFFTAKEKRSFGQLACTKEFLSYAEKRESAPLKDRLDNLIKFASANRATVNDEPFKILYRFRKTLSRCDPSYDSI
ncbi:hypothetical protein [Iodidimonas gelatinilytica]|uniref:hypothetical protein n=1 Tax=Iodidimonas gelatinilytica TaxID=1236966 RepID=UPI00123167AA|nr:hypothetical protein [Iodidimonas gelatinilytica]